MKEKRYYYYMSLQFLGLRYAGWQKQANAKAVQEVVDKFIAKVLGDDTHFKTLGAGRTDSGVSANEFACELFVYKHIEDSQGFMDEFNSRSPSDIRLIDFYEVDENFKIMDDAKEKEYVYLFSYGKEKNHPYCAPFLVNFEAELDIELMKEGAKLLEGHHNFLSFAYKPKENSIFMRTLRLSEIRENDVIEASFFPNKSYAFHAYGKGFMRNQVRMMMGALVKLGRGDISLDELSLALKGEWEGPIGFVAAAEGLSLRSIHYPEVLGSDND